MTYFVIIDVGGVIHELYSSDNGNVPQDAVEVSDEIGEVLRKCSNFGAYRLEDGALVAVQLPAKIPDITPRQARLALNQLGLRSAVEAAVAAADQDTKDMWQYASVFLRTDPTLVAMAQGLGMTGEQLDDIFLLAATK